MVVMELDVGDTIAGAFQDFTLSTLNDQYGLDSADVVGKYRQRTELMPRYCYLCAVKF